MGRGGGGGAYMGAVEGNNLRGFGGVVTGVAMNWGRIGAGGGDIG